MKFADIKPGQIVRLTKTETVEGKVVDTHTYSISIKNQGVFTDNYGWEVELVKDAPIEAGWYVVTRNSDGSFYGTYYVNDEGHIATNPEGDYHTPDDWFWYDWNKELTLTRMVQA